MPSLSHSQRPQPEQQTPYLLRTFTKTSLSHKVYSLLCGFTLSVLHSMCLDIQMSVKWYLIVILICICLIIINDVDYVFICLLAIFRSN